MAKNISDLPHALAHSDELTRLLDVRSPAVFLDYDGTLTPIVDRPEDAVISHGMRRTVRELTGRCRVCVVSGRDRRVVQELMGLDNLIVAGSHGFDIWSPEGTVEREEGAEFEALLDEVKRRLHEELDPIEGALVELKRISIAAHYRLVSDEERPRVRKVVDTILAEHPEDLKITPGKMVYEIQPKIEWDKGRAMLYLLETLDLDRDDVVPLYLGDDVTDEDAFETLAERGVGIFVGSPDDPEVAALEWTFAYDSFDPDEEGLRGALTSTGNGYFCSRGAAEWADADDVHYPGTYMHGGYNRETTIMAGRPVLNEDLVNLPNWLVLKLQIEDELVNVNNVELLSYRHELDVRNATVVRAMRFRDRAGRETTLLGRRFVSIADMHQGAIEWTITPENWSGKVIVISALDGRVMNRGVARYRQLEGRHLEPDLTRAIGPDVIALRARTRQSHIYIAEAARTRVYGEHEVVSVGRDLYQIDNYIQETLTFDVEEDSPVRVEKMVAIYSSRDHAINEPLANAIKAVGRYEPFAEAFRGHVFWDELYIYPFLDFRLPEITRELVMYRYRRLDEARAAAKDAGYRGAMYPWQSGSDGKEETQVVHLNPRSGRWDRDLSHNQRHVNAAIFYNVWRYYQATEDYEFLLGYGAEMMLEIARFWSSIAKFNPDRGRYEIHGVMGPDEFHEKYPDSEEEGLRNNAYTNVMVAWICETAQKVLDLLPDTRRRSLCAKIGLSENELQMWKDTSHRMFVPFHGDGIISQFEGYEELEELDWEFYRAKYGNIQRLDRILRAEGDTPDRYKLSKQADALMLFFLFPEEELRRLFERLR